MSNLLLVSIVATGHIQQELELENLANDLDVYSRRWDPEQHPGLYIKLEKNGPTITLYRTGAFNIRGAANRGQIEDHRLGLANSLCQLGIDSPVGKLKITNMVFSGNLGYSVNLNELVTILGLESVEYEPEQFPGLIYRVSDGVILVFSSGKLVVTGFVEKESATQALEVLKSKIDPT